MLSIYQTGRAGTSTRGNAPESTARLPRRTLLQYNWNAWLNFIRAHVILELTKREYWYLLCDETVESEYEQQSSADGGDDEAELVQVSDRSSLRGLH